MNRRSTVIPALLFAVVPLLFIVGVVAFQLLKNVPEARIARANTLASFKTIRAANAVDEAIQDAERGQRGFLITGREAYLDPYTRAKERLPQLMIELQQASVASPDQQPRLLRLESDITTKMNELAATIARDAAAGLRRGQGDREYRMRVSSAWQRSAPICGRSWTRPMPVSVPASHGPRPATNASA